MVLVIYGTIEQLADNTEDINRCGDDRATSHNHEYTVEEVGMLE